MSIEDEIRARCQDGSLVEMEPLLSGRSPRIIFAARALAKEIDDGFSAQIGSTAYRVGLLINDMDHFSKGGLMTVGYKNEKVCLLKPLDPREDEIWELRSRDPDPGIRVFGRFAITDVFVATHMAWRHDLKGWKHHSWAREIRQTKTIWRQLFITYPPLVGVKINDYISESVIEVGDIP